MSTKRMECYKAIFEYIEQNVFHLQPNQFITDWEKAIRSALSKVYPNASLKGCWYHYCSAIRRKSRSIGMHDLLQTNNDACSIYKQILSLPSADLIIDGYNTIKKKRHESTNYTKNLNNCSNILNRTG